VTAESFTAVGGWFTPPATVTNRTASAHVLTVDPFDATMVTVPVPSKSYWPKLFHFPAFSC
jgi:hypothetical protein